jgi:signal transduction histidine kinase
VQVGTRITATTSALVAVVLAGYALLSLRDVAAERREQALREGRNLARSLQAIIEGSGVDVVLSRPRAVEAALAKSRTGWRIALLDASALSEPITAARAAQLDRLRKIVELRPSELTSELDQRAFHVVPLRVPDPDAPDGFQVVGAVEVSRSIAHLDSQQAAEIWQTVATLGMVVGTLVLAILLSTRLLVSQPIGKLIAGIDDVAHGDLSHVVLSERDDEIGALATRFNAMTTSLRESRAEAQRQNDARLHLEQRLSESSKMATIGQLAAEIAHEVGTPLNVIGGRARNLAKKADDTEKVEKNASIIADQAARITRIIQRLLDFTRRKVGTVDPVPLNMNEITLSTMEFLEGQFAKARVRTTLARAEGLPAIEGIQDQLQQVLLNLFLNASEAMTEGGELRVETSSIERKRPGLEAAPSQTYVCVTVADTGPGIPPELRDKIFEPFYTSKTGQGGTGLGLAVSQGLVKDHDGWIEIDDTPGGGATFRVFLPALDDP